MGLLALTCVYRAVRHVGRRGAYLLFLALLDLLVGYALLQPLPLGLSRGVLYEPFIAIMPIGWWAAWWAATGVAALVAGFWHPARSVVFSAATALKTGWGLGYFIGWVEGLAAFSRGYQSAVIFVGFAVVTLIISGWRENGA